MLNNFYNGDPIALVRVAQITDKKPSLVQVAICDSEFLGVALSAIGVTTFIHFAGLKSMGASVQKQLDNYENNVAGCLHLINLH